MELDSSMYLHDPKLVEKWEPVLEGINDDYIRRATAQLLENQAKAVIETSLDEAISPGTTTTGKLGTFQKFAFPLVRRIYPELIANSICGVQPMQGPVSQVFYLGNSRVHNTTVQNVYSKFNLTYRGFASSAIGSVADGGVGMSASGTWGGVGANGLDGDVAQAGFDTDNLLNLSGNKNAGTASGTLGGRIASWPNTASILGYSLSGGERLTGTGIPEITFHIEQEAVAARTRKMRALWTIEASQDLKAYHNLDLEKELTTLLSNEIKLEVDRELIEDIRMIAYGYHSQAFGGVDQNYMDNNYISMGGFGGTGTASQTAGGGDAFVPAQFTYDFTDLGAAAGATELGSSTSGSNVFAIDFSQTNLAMYPRHVGEVYANLLALLNLASQDIYRTTWRGAGNWIVTSPLIASLLESAAKLEGGIKESDKPSNMGKGSIEHRGKFAGKYDLYVDPLFPQDEILMGYKGGNAMDAGFIYAPYIPLQALPTVVDPETFQPRKGILTRYGKVAIEPYNRWYRIIRVIGPTANFLFSPFSRNTGQSNPV